MSLLPPLHEHIRTYANPHLGRLTHQPGCMTARRTWMVSLNVVLGLGVFMLGITALSPVGGTLLALTCAAWVILPLTVLVPPFVVLQAINITVDEVSAPEFDVLRASTLSDWQLGGGFVVATLWRVRTFITTLIGTWLAVIVSVFVALVVLNSLGDLEFQRQNYQGFRLAWLVGVVGVGQIGSLLALTVIPIAVAMRFGKTIPFTLIMPFVALVFTTVPPMIAVVVLPPENEPLDVLEVIASLAVAGWGWAVWVAAFLAAIKWVRYGHA